MVQKVTRKRRVANQRVRQGTRVGTSAVDRRLLAQASKEAAEGVEPPPPPVERDLLTLDVGEYESIVSQLKECTHAFVDAWAKDYEFASFGEALIKLHAVRLNLESCVMVEVQS